METFALPPELQELEHGLLRNARSRVPATLEERVLRGVRSELKRERSRSRWFFAATLAAMVIVVLNVSMSASRVTDFGMQEPERVRPVQELAGQIRALLPQMTDRAALQQALLLRLSERYDPYLRELPPPNAQRRLAGQLAPFLDGDQRR